MRERNINEKNYIGICLKKIYNQESWNRIMKENIVF